MEKYYIKNGDSLESIADELGLKITELISYHNECSKMHDNIKNNDLPKWTDHIFIPDSVEVLKKNKEDLLSVDKVILIQKEIAPVQYLIQQKIDMQVSGTSMIDSETEIIWEYSKAQKGGVFYGDIQQKSHQVKYIKSIYRQLAEYMQKFNRPLEHLVVELFSEGNIKSLANQLEIKESWSILKEELKQDLGDTLEEKNMLKGGDEDFKNTLPLIKKNVLYNLFFNDLYGCYLELNRFIEKQKEEYTSQIFSNEKVFIITKRKIERERNIAKIKFYSVPEQNKNLHLREIYNTQLREFLKEDYNYSLTWSVEYHFDILTGKMLLCHSKIQEQASSKYSHVMEHKIILS